MIIKKIIPFIFILSLVSGCNGNSSSTEEPTSPSTSTTTTSEQPTPKKKGLIPEVGEVRELFSPGPVIETRIYNYCPTVFIENGEEHVYYCTNQIDGNVTDFIGYRKGVLRNEEVTFTSNSFVLSHGSGGSWDSRHDCDPSVIKGEFKFHGKTYNYLMAYLGCLTSNSKLNETGIAVSETPEGPWIKCDYKLDGETKINPIVPYSDFGITNAWGTGQPSLVSVDKKGRVLLFTTIGSETGTYTNIREYDFSDIDNYQLIRQKLKIKEDGIRYTSTGGGFINNADFAYDETNRRFLMVKGRQFFGKDGLTPDFIADTLDVYYIEDTEGTNIGDVFFLGNASSKIWRHINYIDQSKTGFLRNHNACLITDPYGHHIMEDNKLGVAFARSDEGQSSNWSYLSTYRIYATSVAYPNN